MHDERDASREPVEPSQGPSPRGRLWGRRSRGQAAGERVPPRGGRSRFERVLFSFMGPPQLGDLNAPVRQLPAAPVVPCPTCGQPYEEHEVVRDPRLTYTRCPPSRS